MTYLYKIKTPFEIVKAKIWAEGSKAIVVEHHPDFPTWVHIDRAYKTPEAALQAYLGSHLSQPGYGYKVQLYRTNVLMFQCVLVTGSIADGWYETCDDAIKAFLAEYKFAEHLESASERVSRWPAWKRNVLGTVTVGKTKADLAEPYKMPVQDASPVYYQVEMFGGRPAMLTCVFGIPGTVRPSHLHHTKEAAIEAFLARKCLEMEQAAKLL